MVESELDTLRLSALSVIISSQLVASIVKRRRLKRKLQEENCLKVSAVRKIHDRPVYKHSTWWAMLAKGDCKVLGHPQNKLFRRRFSVPFSMFKDIVEESRLWVLDNGKTLGEPVSSLIVETSGDGGEFPILIDSHGRVDHISSLLNCTQSTIPIIRIANLAILEQRSRLRGWPA